MRCSRLLLFFSCSIFFIVSCSVSKNTFHKIDGSLLLDSAIRTGHIGISIYEPATNTYWYNYNADKYFIPASNTKLFTLYAGLKYLGDSLTAALYDDEDGKIRLIGTADPSFLHPDFKYQPLFDFVKQQAGKKITLFEIVPNDNRSSSFKPLGRGWAWDDYNSSYMAERNFFPIYGNMASFSLQNNQVKVSPSFFSNKIYQYNKPISGFNIERQKETNFFFVSSESKNTKNIETPIHFGYDDKILSIESSLLGDTLKQSIEFGKISFPNFDNLKRIYSQPSDSIFKPMMHRSDNFFAEQILLMASNELLGYMNEGKLIDSLLKTDLKDIPQKPKWVDGSGLSRYNLFTPHSFIYILNKMKEEFGFERLKNILPTGGTGTLSSYYKNEADFIYAKTGTLSNNCALSGFLITKKGKVLLFSIINNNYITGATPVRKAIEKFLIELRENN